IDTVTNYGFLFAATAVWMKRKRDHSAHVGTALMIFLGYCGLSLLWSDGGFFAAKQYVKMINLVLIALLVASESDQVEAITTVIRRTAYILTPLSLLFIKYYPEYGMGYDNWTGGQIIFGVTEGKNLLGQLCLIIGLILVSSLLIRWSESGFSRD